MAISFIKKLENNAIIGGWKIVERIEELSQGINSQEITHFLNYRNHSIKRKKEWLAVRQLLCSLTDKNEKISYRFDGSPFLVSQNYHISITHSNAYAVIYLCNQNKIGVDIQYIKNMSRKGVGYFMNDAEIDFLTPNNVLQLNLIWSAKETIFKFHGDPSLNIKDNISIKPFDQQQSGILMAYIIISNQNILVRIAYEVFNEYVLTWTIS